jgi:hypothetical protein
MMKASHDPRLSSDLLWGASQIAAELFGDPGRRRKVYSLKNELPLFRVRQTLCGFRSELRRHFENQGIASKKQAIGGRKTRP